MKLPSFFTRKNTAPSAAQFDPVKPEIPFCVIGDVHGRFDLLQKLTPKLPGNTSIICVGDLIDRGEQSADVLRYVKSSPNITPIIGNHEAMLLDFLTSPETAGRRWLRNGGLQTVASFGIAGASETAGAEDLLRLRDRLFDAMGEDMVQWLNNLNSIGWSGNVAVVHAGANPALPLEDHKRDTFIWGHPEFRKKPRTDGFWIVHGHTVVEKPQIADGRISIDTGAYATGRLTAAILTDGNVEFVST